jgi:hypothetical protein
LSRSVLLQVAAAAAAAEAENEEGDEEGRASTAAAAVKENYDYLLSMAIYSLTWEKVQVCCWAVFPTRARGNFRKGGQTPQLCMCMCIGLIAYKTAAASRAVLVLNMVPTVCCALMSCGLQDLCICRRRLMQ